MEKTLGLSVVIGAVLASKYASTQQKAAKLGQTFHDTDNDSWRRKVQY